MGLMTPFFKRDEDGFTTVGTAVALLLALVLAFGAVQACWTQSRAGQIQYVADAAALAADGAIGEFIFYTEVIDAALLSFALLGIGSYAASGVAAFVPGGEGVAAKLADVGSRIFKARDSFASSAWKGLNAAQKALPALCTLRAMEVIDANAQASGLSYAGVAVPVPFGAVEVVVPDIDSAQEESRRIEEKEEEVEEETQKQAVAQEKLDKAKAAAWKADCGGEPSMRERATVLAGLSNQENPSYSNVETWRFSFGIERAKNYYAARFDQEKGSVYDGTPEEIGESVARKAFYRYALEQVSLGKVVVDESGVEHPQVKMLARNTDQIRGTVLYTEAAYPVSSKGKKKTLHAYSKCPSMKSENAAGFAAVSSIDSGDLAVCSECKFSATTLGRVPSASTSISNGFEYSYRLFAEAANEYEKASEDLKKSSKVLDKDAEEMVSSFEKALSSLKSTRIDFSPPGRYGCICLVVAGETSFDAGSAITGAIASVGTRAAISAATLAVDESVDQAQVLKNVGTGLVPGESLTGTIAKTIFGLWGASVGAYSEGVEGVTSLIESTLSSIPLVGTDLSTSVSKSFISAVEDAGLKPAKVEANKPVLVSSSLVLAKDGSALSQSLLLMQQGAATLSKGDLDLGDLVDFIDQIDADAFEVSDSGKLVLATISFAAAGLGIGEKEISIEAAQDLLEKYSAALSKLRSEL